MLLKTGKIMKYLKFFEKKLTKNYSKLRNVKKN